MFKKKILNHIMIFLFIIFCVCARPLFADTITLDSSLHDLTLGPHMEILEDKDNLLTIEDIKSEKYRDRWFSSKKTYPGFGFTRSVFWVRFTFENRTDKDIEFYLEHGYPLLDDIKLYIYGENNKYSMVQSGDSLPYSKRLYDHRTFIFPLKLKANTGAVYYLRHKTSSSMNIHLTIWSSNALKKNIKDEDHMLMIYYGIIIIMIINYLLVYLFLRHISYLYYVLFIFSFFIFIITQNGASYQFLWPGVPWMANYSVLVSLCLLNVFGNRFMVVFLEIKKNSSGILKLTDVLLYLLFITCISLFFSPFFDIYLYILSFAAFITLLQVFGAIYAGILLSLRKQRTAYLFTVAWLAFLVGCILYIGKSFGFIPTNSITKWSLHLGSTTMLVFLSIAMVDRINTTRKELKTLSEHLDEKVKQRTMDLLFSEIGTELYPEMIARISGTGKEKLNSASVDKLVDKDRALSIIDLSQDISVISNIDVLLSKVISKAVEISEADSSYIFILNWKDKLELKACQYMKKISLLHKDEPNEMNLMDNLTPEMRDRIEQIAHSVYTMGDYIITTTYEDSQSSEKNNFPTAKKSILCVPIILKSKKIGVCCVDRPSSRGGFTIKDANLLLSFLSHIAAAIDNAFLHHKESEKNNYNKNIITPFTEEKIKRALEYINKNYTYDISREGLANYLDTSPNHLGKYFKMYTGKKIGEYTNELRIKAAAEKLRETNDNIIDIAYSVGFESLSTFNRAFLKVMNITPSQYREEA